MLPFMLEKLTLESLLSLFIVREGSLAFPLVLAYSPQALQTILSVPFSFLHREVSLVPQFAHLRPVSSACPPGAVSKQTWCS